MGNLFDTSFLWQARGPQFESPIAQQRRVMSLRDMTDQRRITEQQYQTNLLELTQKKQQYEDEREFQRGLLTLGPNPTVKDVLALPGPIRAQIPLMTALAKMEEAESTRQTAELTRKQKQGELDTKEQQRLADTLYGVRSIPDQPYATGEPRPAGSTRQAAMDI